MKAAAQKGRKFAFSDVLLSLVFCLMILGFSLAFWILPNKAESAEENRVLTQLPTFSADALFSGAYTQEIAAYYGDQFPLRQQFLRLAAGYDLALLGFESSSVMLGSAGHLIVRDDWYDSSTLTENAENIENFAIWAKDNAIDFYVAVPGRSQDILQKYAPAFYSGRTDSLERELAELFSFASTTDLITPLRQAADDGFYVYYKTDHHWTTLGAYMAYRQLGDLLGYEPYDYADFDVEIASDSFFGTTWSSSGIRTSSADRIEFWRWNGDDELVCTVYGQDGFYGFYDRSYLDTKDKYSAFLSGNNALVKINDPSCEREKLLIIKDSFAHSIAPFLARHFDLVLVDLRYYNKSCAELCKNEGIDKILLLCNADTLYSGSEFGKLNMGLK